jgi:hypothetical protein
MALYLRLVKPVVVGIARDPQAALSAVAAKAMEGSCS